MRNEKLRQAREMRGWTQKDVANTIDLPDVRSLRRWERGEAFPSLFYRAKLCELFGMDAQDLQLVPPTQDGQADEDRVEGMEQEWSALPTVVTQDSNRRRLLERVYAFWIRGVLEQSQREMATIQLHLQIQPEALTDPWGHIIRRPQQTGGAVPAEKDIVQVYEEAYRELLILGEPGAGKTTLLLHLANMLLKRAFVEEAHAIPVVLNLSSWSGKQTAFVDWLVDELHTRYYVPHTVARGWVDHGKILPLLDGLDEVSPDLLDSCISAINIFHQTYNLIPLVVCTRSIEYFGAQDRLALQQAVTIQPLTWSQIEQALLEDERFEAVQGVLYEDTSLRDIIDTPLMLRILVTTSDSPMPAIVQMGSLQVRRQQMIAAYVEQMLARQRTALQSAQPRARRQLAWLALQMKRHYQSELYLERMQLDWLPSVRQQRLCYGLFCGLWAASVCGGLIGLIDVPLDGLAVALLVLPCLALLTGIVTGIMGAWLESLWPSAVKKVIVGVSAGSMVSILGVWADGIFASHDIALGAIMGTTICVTFLLMSLNMVMIQPTEAVSWSWKRVQRTFSSSLAVGSLLVICIGTIGGLFGWFLGGLGMGMVFILLFGMCSFLIAGVLNGFSGRMIDEHIFAHPNQGIYRSLYHAYGNALIATLLTWLVLAAIGALCARFLPGLGPWPNFTLFSELAFSITTGLIIGFYRGGEASLKHILLRLFLWGGGYIPWNYPRFLDEAARAVILRKVGGGYLFIHQLVLDYFASLASGEPGAQVQADPSVLSAHGTPTDASRTVLAKDEQS